MADVHQLAAEQALILLAHGVDPYRHVDQDEGRHTRRCWEWMARKGADHECFCNGVLARPLAALFDATSDREAVPA